MVMGESLSNSDLQDISQYFIYRVHKQVDVNYDVLKI